MSKLASLISQASTKFDLTDPENHDSLYRLTSEIRDQGLDVEQLLADKQLPLEFRLALHLAKSKNYIDTIRKKIKVAVVFAMWGEHNRLLPKSADNPNGEDTLRTKIRQLNWVTEGTPVEWLLYVVDDGCPYGSGKIAESILSAEKSTNVQVIYLADAIPTDNGPLKNLPYVDASKKGGAIILGASEAIRDGVDVIIYTDADNSVHLGQIGLLLKPYLEQSARVVLGNRKDLHSTLVKQESRWGIGIKLLRHMQRLVGSSIFSLGINDSQAAFKLYETSLLEKIIADPAVFDFSFDSDWIAGAIQHGVSFHKVPFAFVDSFAESASIVQGPMTTWETLLLGLVKVVRHRGLPHNKKMAAILEEEIKSAADLDLLIHHLPPQLESAGDSQIGDESIMSPGEVREWIRQRKKKPD